MRDLLTGPDGLSPKSPETAAQENMRPQLPRRFYKQAEVTAGSEGFGVALDGKALKTPARKTLLLPTREAAELVADEWNAQEECIDPASMPVTRLVNTALDGIANDPQAVLEDIVRFASGDLVFYRADFPESLVENQARHWDPVLDYVEQMTGAHFETGTGLMHIAQAADSIRAFSLALKPFDDPLQLACLHTMTTLTGSALISFCHACGNIDSGQAWEAAHVDENHNISHWGEDYEAAQRRKLRLDEMTAASRLFFALRRENQGE